MCYVGHHLDCPVLLWDSIFRCYSNVKWVWVYVREVGGDWGKTLQGIFNKRSICKGTHTHLTLIEEYKHFHQRQNVPLIGWAWKVYLACCMWKVFTFCHPCFKESSLPVLKRLVTLGLGGEKGNVHVSVAVYREYQMVTRKLATVTEGQFKAKTRFHFLFSPHVAGVLVNISLMVLWQ